jgi:hypothetical protein
VRENETSRYTLEECEEYAFNLKGIIKPPAYAKKIHQTGEDDKKIAKFLADKSELAAKKAEEDAKQLAWTAREIVANGGPRHDWEREILKMAGML